MKLKWQRKGNPSNFCNMKLFMDFLYSFELKAFLVLVLREQDRKKKRKTSEMKGSPSDPAIT